MIVREVLQRSASWLDKRGCPSARLDAELLLAFVLATDRITLYAHSDRPLEEAELATARDLLRRRAAGEPVAYLTGRREFYGLAFEVTRDVLVPRPETELLVDRARELEPGRLLDLGTGSGCIAIACAKYLPDAAIVATDVSEEALAVARGNAERLGVEIDLRAGDLFAPVAGERFDVVVSNPPYVTDDYPLDGQEPEDALRAGAEGLDVIGRILKDAPACLEKGGTLLVEIGEDQEAAVRALAAKRFERVEIRRDLAGLPRILEVRGTVPDPDQQTSGVVR